MEIRAARARPGAAAVRGHDAHARQRLRARGGLPLHRGADRSPATCSASPTATTCRARTSTTTSSRSRLQRPVRRRSGCSRNFYATSSCGICGKAALDEVEVRCDAGRRRSGRVRRRARCPLPERAPRRADGVRPDRRAARGGAVHRRTGELVAIREDVGRHNAVDKVVGEQLLAGQRPARRARSCRSAGVCRSRSCRRPRSRASRWWLPSARRRHSPSRRASGSA